MLFRSLNIKYIEANLMSNFRLELSHRGPSSAAGSLRRGSVFRCLSENISGLASTMHDLEIEGGSACRISSSLVQTINYFVEFVDQVVTRRLDMRAANNRARESLG